MLPTSAHAASSLPHGLLQELRTDHANETGAVMMYPAPSAGYDMEAQRLLRDMLEQCRRRRSGSKEDEPCSLKTPPRCAP